MRPICGHSNREVKAKGLCGSCYNTAWVRDKKPKRRYIPEAAQRRRLRHRYGITEDEYDTMLQKQNGRCAICSTSKSYRLYVDHCHTTGRVRKLLCAGCNTIVGSLESPLRESAELYIKENTIDN